MLIPSNVTQPKINARHCKTEAVSRLHRYIEVADGVFARMRFMIILFMSVAVSIMIGDQLNNYSLFGFVISYTICKRAIDIYICQK